ncbi:auxin-responsive protein IAA30 [Trifolium repens]|nr:auxin-responsive protein IAA30 [Trifolium repens]
MMNSFDPQRWQQDHRRQKNIIGASSSSSNNSSNFYGNNMGKYKKLMLEDDDLVSTVVPAVTVVLEGRSIGQRINLHNHGSYQSLAKALRQMFVDCTDDDRAANDHLDLSNAIPGHLIAYEDMENDLLLAGDLTWKDFVRVAKRIRILPAKGNSRKGTTSTRDE